MRKEKQKPRFEDYDDGRSVANMNVDCVHGAVFAVLHPGLVSLNERVPARALCSFRGVFLFGKERVHAAAHRLGESLSD